MILKSVYKKCCLFSIRTWESGTKNLWPTTNGVDPEILTPIDRAAPPGVKLSALSENRASDAHGQT